MTVKFLRAATAVLVAALLVTSAALPVAGQQQQSAPPAGQRTAGLNTPPRPDFTAGRSHFPNPFAPYAPLHVRQAELTNSPRVEQLISDGKLMLSLQDAVSLALENNLDISVQRYNPWIAETGVLRAKAGQGTAVGSFDPTITGLFNWDRRSIPINNPFLSGSGTAQTALTNYNTNANFGLTQGFASGTAYSVTWNNNRNSTSSAATFLNPSVQSALNFGFQQQLLDGLGFVSNKRFLRLARNNKRIADLLFADQVMFTVSAVQNMYWDLVFAREDVNVKSRSVELAEKLYNDNKRQVEIGTLAPIEVVRAEAEVARTRQDLIVAQTFLLQQQTLLKAAITKNTLDPQVLLADIVPTDVISKSPELPVIPLPDAVKEAWEKRPDVKQAQVDLESRNITRRATRNAMLPTLTLSGQFGGTGLAGNSRVTTSVPSGAFSADTTVPLVDAAGNPLLVNGVPAFAGVQLFNTTTTTLENGFGGALARVRAFDFPNYSVALNLNMPIRNRAAQADNAQAILEERQSETRLQQLQNTVVVQVRNAQIALEQSQARVSAAQKSRELQERTLDAEQKKYQLGASTIFLVIQAQRDLSQAQSAEVRALADLLKARVNFDQALGRTLETNNISISDAKSGKPARETNIPGSITGTLNWPANNAKGKY